MHLSILLLATDRQAADAVTAALAGAGHGVVTVTTPEELVRQAPGYGLLIIDNVPTGTSVPDVIAELRKTWDETQIPILCIAQSDDLEERIALLEGGADDVITKPFDQRELEARIEALVLRFQRASERGPAAAATSIGDPHGRRLVAVYSPKGGVGTTTIATNLALIAAERRPDTVVLLDLDLQFGQVASHLNLKVKQSVLELARDETALREPELLRTFTTRHDGLHVLAAPPSPGFTSLITAEHIEQILQRALDSFETVIVDAGATLDDRTLAIFSRADTVIVPVLPEIPALNAVHLLLEQLAETGAMGASTMFVLNNAFARELLRLRDIENALGGRIAADLPYDPFVYLKAVNEGVPVVRGAPKSGAAEALRKLAKAVFGAERKAEIAAPVRKGLLSRLRTG